MEDNIKQVVKDVRYLIATDCNNETIQARIENYIKERDRALSIANVVGRSEQFPQIHGLTKCECGKVYDVDIENNCPSCGN
ncbi:MAG: hypothetical protein L0J60_07750 [Psychroflexus sp.]|nr:hypothetical protein [Psychroflexus sp.]